MPPGPTRFDSIRFETELAKEGRKAALDPVRILTMRSARRGTEWGHGFTGDELLYGGAHKCGDLGTRRRESQERTVFDLK